MGDWCDGCHSCVRGSTSGACGGRGWAWQRNTRKQASWGVRGRQGQETRGLPGWRLECQGNGGGGPGVGGTRGDRSSPFAILEEVAADVGLSSDTSSGLDTHTWRLWLPRQCQRLVGSAGGKGTGAGAPRALADGGGLARGTGRGREGESISGRLLTCERFVAKCWRRETGKEQRDPRGTKLCYELQIQKEGARAPGPHGKGPATADSLPPTYL